MNAQTENKTRFGKGLQFIASDSSFSAKIGFRFQTLYDGAYTFSDKDWHDQFLIRRSRLKFDGFVYSPKLVYKAELALSNRDIGSEPLPQTSFASNIVLDAVLKWNFYRNFSLWAGQTKLPGNRERVISSQKLQFVDRSLVNGRYNLDRDVGLQLHHEHSTGKVVWREALSWSMGDGRNITSDNIRNEEFLGNINLGGYDYTARVEVLPFGEFKSDGDYVGSDIYREETPKLAVGVTYDFNDDAPRTNGQLGKFLSQQRDLSSLFVDAMFKYRGWSAMAEYADRKALDGPVVSYNDKGNVSEAFFTGNGINLQAGYLFRNNWELAGRYTFINPDNEIGRPDVTEYTVGVSKYIVGHSLKVQSDLSYIDPVGNNNEEIRFRMQVEMAF